MNPGTRLKVCIDARLEVGAYGGVQQAVMGLASGLSALVDGDESYRFLTDAGAAGWLEPWLAGPCGSLEQSRSEASPSRRFVRSLIRTTHLGGMADAVYRRVVTPRIPDAPPIVERSGTDVMHFMLQNGFRTSVPSIYVPHDLQHVHLPGLFDRWQLEAREAFYAPLCEQARIVVALSRWGKRDLVEQFGLPDAKVRVVGWAPILDTYPAPSPRDVASMKTRLGSRFENGFAFFPAQTWRHKNHLALLDALAVLRGRHGLSIPTVFCGHRNGHAPSIERSIRALRLQEQVRMLGFVTEIELRALYQLSRLLVFPSKFEGFGMPLLEAFAAGVPVACSSATCLPEIAGDCALLFDPDDVDRMADAVARAWTDDSLRNTMIARGSDHVKRLTWDRTARTYRALYRLVAGRPLGPDDEALLDATL